MKYIQTFNYLKFWIIFTFFNNISSLIVLPFKTIENNGENPTFNISNNIYSDILVGNTGQLLDVFFTSNIYTYYLDEESCKGNNFYSKNLSSYNLSLENYVLLDEDEKAIQINETIYLYKDLNLTQKIKIEDFPILVRINHLSSEKLCLLIGLLFRMSGPMKIINFIEQLKKKNLIESYTWTIKYTTEKEGLLIIGEEPHIYDPQNYNESHLRTVNPMITEYSYSWNIDFNKIYSGNNIISENIFCILSQGNNYIMGNKEYNKSIVENFFNEYLNKKICFYYHNSYLQSYYYCDKKLFNKNDMIKLPILSFLNINLEERFTFGGEELFFEGKDYYYFKIYFNDFSQNSWVIGKLFLKKYQFIFNHDKKLIEYYKINITNQNEEEEEDKKGNSPYSPKNNNNNINVYIYIISGIILIIIIGFILLIKLYLKPLCCNKHRKKLVNELVDEEEYPNNQNESEKRNKDQLLDMNF